MDENQGKSPHPDERHNPPATQAPPHPHHQPGTQRDTYAKGDLVKRKSDGQVFRVAAFVRPPHELAGATLLAEADVEPFEGARAPAGEKDLTDTVIWGS